MKCPKCKGEMEPGGIVDRGHYDNPLPPVWTSRIGLKLENKKKVIHYCCRDCGFIEAYAK